MAQILFIKKHAHRQANCLTHLLIHTQNCQVDIPGETVLTRRHAAGLERDRIKKKERKAKKKERKKNERNRDTEKKRQTYMHVCG